MSQHLLRPPAVYLINLYHFRDFSQLLSTEPGLGHFGNVWAVVGDNLGEQSYESDGNVPMATLEPLVGWSEEKMDELRQKSGFDTAIA